MNKTCCYYLLIKDNFSAAQYSFSPRFDHLTQHHTSLYNRSPCRCGSSLLSLPPWVDFGKTSLLQTVPSAADNLCDRMLFRVHASPAAYQTVDRLPVL